MDKKAYYTARAFEILIGLYLVSGAIPKALDIDKFAVQIASYKVLSAPSLLFAAALFTVSVEVGLGMALLLKLRLKGLVLVGLQGMLLIFSALILYAWQVHGIEDCGCFPIIKMSPPVSLTKNALMILAACYMGWVTVLKTTETQTPMVPRRNMALRLTLCAALALLFTAYAWQDMDRDVFALDESDSDGISFAQFELFMDEGYFNLGKGLHLVAILSTSCSECREKIPELNELWTMPGLPPIVALCYEDVPGELNLLRAETMAAFPMHSLGDRALLYFSMIDQESFRLSLVAEGRQVHFWDGFVPEYDEIIRVMESLD